MTDLHTSPAPLIDIGVNLSNKRFEKDLEDVLKRAQKANVSQLILTGTSEEESDRVFKLTQKHANNFPNMLYSTCGVHPHDAKHFNSDTLNHLKALAENDSVVAIGETGLDFDRNFSSPTDQEKAFEAQLELAIELQLPVFMHERDAHQRQFEILKQYRDHLIDGVIHCFTGDKTALFNYLDIDLHIGVTGWVCDERRGQQLQRLVNNIPLHRLMLETDSPYLTPRTIKPKPKGGRNEPAFLPWVLDGIAEHRNESALEVAEKTTAAAKTFFRID
ncbi:MAG: YchF/TatD family DNA exonuclease [Porticoccus sp.]|nr:YchF/TatD family DNA exonuclease [Porticoccus sp.]MBQ0807025.1 YchF/TatD family DNA exonuclease [Porticoccus sp.]MDX2349228.1 TatD family hydrolase [Porticoccus sp.]